MTHPGFAARCGRIGWLAGCLGGAATLVGCAAPTVSYVPRNPCDAWASADLARVVVQRPAGRGVAIAVADDDQPIGRLGPGGRLCWERYPGKAQLSMYLFDGASIKASTLQIDLAAGQTGLAEALETGQWKLIQTAP